MYKQGVTRLACHFKQTVRKHYKETSELQNHFMLFNYSTYFFAFLTRNLINIYQLSIYTVCHLY